MSDFKGRHFEGEIVLWVARYAASCCDLEQMIDCDGGTGGQVSADPRDSPFLRMPSTLLGLAASSEWWAPSPQNGGRLEIGMGGRDASESTIARMFLKNPPILILDEATSALDTATEHAIQQSLLELAAGRTSLITAHRLATIRDADRIVVVERQGVVGQGRHAELLAAGGAYRRLHDVQFRA
jgi:hypothetical protein